MADNTETNLHVFSPTFWSKKLGAKFNDAGVMMACVNKDYEGEIKQAGNKVNVQYVDGVVVSTLGSDAINYQDLTASSKQLEIDQKKYFAFAVPDIAKVQANVTLMDKYIGEAKKSIELTKDTYLLSKRADVVAGNVLTEIKPTSSNIYDIFASLRTTLRNANAINQAGKSPDGKRPWVVINPAIEKLIITSDVYKNRSTSVTDKIIRDGAIFEFAGFDILSATNLKAVSNKVEILAGINDAITCASQIVKIETLRDKDQFQDLVRGLYVYGAKTFNGKLLAKVSLDFTP